MYGDVETSVSIDVFQRTAMVEIAGLREENFSLKVLVQQLKEDKKELEEALMRASIREVPKERPNFREVEVNE